MAKGVIGVCVVQAPEPARAVEQLVEADRLGVKAAWMTCGGLLADPLTLYGSVAAQTHRIVMGTSILPTWPRNPVFLAQQILALESLAPGRLQVGIGPSTEGGMRAFGVPYATPLRELREYLTVLRSLLHEGQVNFAGKHLRARARLGKTLATPVLGSALQEKAFELCGAHADGAISWVCPRTYLREKALPALRRGAEKAGRTPPPLVVHTPICVEENPDTVREAAQRQIGMYGKFQFYKDMFASSGHPDAGEGYSQALVDDLVVYGNRDTVAARLNELAGSGIGDILAYPLATGSDPAASFQRSLAAVAQASQG